MNMATMTAFVFVGKAHPNSGGINPTHYIMLSENDRPALVLHDIEGKEVRTVIIPTIENMVDDIYLMISVYILKKVNPSRELSTDEKKSMYDIISEEERNNLYKESMQAIKDAEIKVAFNILDRSTLNDQISKIENYSNDYEITITTKKKEFNRWNGKVEER